MKRPLAGKKAFYAKGFAWAANGRGTLAHYPARISESWAFDAFCKGFSDGRHSMVVELMKSKSIAELMEAAK